MSLLDPAVPASGTFEGPWLDAFWFEVPVGFRSKSNFRSDDRDWGSHANFESNIAILARRATPASWDLGPAKGSVAKRPTIVSFIFARTLLDAGNVSKSVLDACETIVYHNDASVRHPAVLVERTGKANGGHVAFARLGADAPVRDVLSAAAALQEAWAEIAGI